MQKEQRSLHNRVAFTGDIWYDLHGKVVNVTSEKWEIVDYPCIFRNINSPQVEPIKPNNNRRYLKEIFSSCSIIHQYQRLILEVYTICLFIEGLQHPIILPNGVPGSGKSLLFEMLSLIVDPHKTLGGTSLKWLPKGEKDRRISIYSDYLSLFDNLSYVSSEAMDELCMWVTGYGKTERALFTNNKAISYSGKRPIGINGINIPIARADFRLPFTRTMVFPLPGSPHSTLQFKPIFYLLEPISNCDFCCVCCISNVELCFPLTCPYTRCINNCRCKPHRIFSSR